MADDSRTGINVQLIQLLLLEAGRVMEDVSADVALALPQSREVIAARVEELSRAAQTISALSDAARVLVRSGTEDSAI